MKTFTNNDMKKLSDVIASADIDDKYVGFKREMMGLSKVGDKEDHESVEPK